MKSHGKSKAVLSAIIFEVNLLQSSRFGDALAVVQANLDAKNYYAWNPAFDVRPREGQPAAKPDTAAPGLTAAAR